MTLLPLLLLLALPSGAPAKDCSKTSYGALPLTDLGAGSYLGRQGGLYPGGVNQRPNLHDAAGRWIAENLVVPRDTEGNPSPTGLVGFVSIGLSNTTQEFQVLLDLLAEDDDLHAKLRLADAARGGVGLEDVVDPADPKGYWSFVQQRIAAAGLDRDQVQVVWLKTAYGTPPSLAFPGWQQQETTDLTTLVRELKQRFPELRLCYVSSRIYGHYSMSVNREEPTAYESGFGFKWLIERQIQGQAALNYDPSAGPEVAPWLSWGPYLWADGETARSDGLQWFCDDFNPDGHHPAFPGRLKVAQMLRAFLRSDATVTPWFLTRASGPYREVPVAPVVR